MRKKLSRFSRILANSRKFDAAKYSIFENSRKFILAKNHCFQFAKVNSHFFSSSDTFSLLKTLSLLKSLHLIILLQLNRESLFSRKMTKAAIRESKFPKFCEFVSSRKFLPQYFLPLK